MVNSIRFNRWMPVALCSALFIGAAQFASAQASATANAFGRAEIVTAITIVKNHDLLFGQIVADAVGGTVSVSTNGTRTTSGPVLLAQSAVPYSTVHQASFTVTGATNYVYTVSLPSAAVTLTGPGSATMSVTGLNSDPSGTGTLAGGTSSLNVGGTLNIAPNQAAGAYSGSFAVTVAYQ